MGKFKREHSLEQRIAESQKIRGKHPDRIPIICEKVDKSPIVDIDKKKYLVPRDLTIGQFICVIRKRLKLAAEMALFLFVDGVIPPGNALLHQVYSLCSQSLLILIDL